MRKAVTIGKLLGWAVLSVSLVGCVRGCPSSRPPIHLNPNMDQQPRYEAQDESDFFYDGSTMRQPVPGTVARGQLRDDEDPFYSGMDAEYEFLASSPVPVTEEILARGADRYTIYCQPCHDKRGNGKGILTERGGVPVPSFHEDRLKEIADGEIFDVITNGKGLMPAYAYPVGPAERWAIVAHVRRLQEKAEATQAALTASR
jgi:mono/diheme cytochrome c family protein